VLRLERGLSLCRSMNNRQELAFVTAFFGLGLPWSGRSDEGISLLREGLAQAAEIEFTASRSWLLGLLSEAYRCGGHLHRGRETALEALELAGRYREAGWEAWAHFMLAQATAQGSGSGPAPPAAYAALARAEELAARLGLRPLRARCQLARAEFLEHEHKAEAAASLATARRMMDEIGVSGWLALHATSSACPGPRPTIRSDVTTR